MKATSKSATTTFIMLAFFRRCKWEIRCTSPICSKSYCQQRTNIIHHILLANWQIVNL